MPQFAYGRKPAIRTRRTFRSSLLMTEALDPLGAPPMASNDYVSAVTVPWGMYKNDVLGDCVCADTAHTLMLRTANTSRIIIPAESDVLGLYETVGGYKPSDPSTDQGCMEVDMCHYLVNTGFLGHKANATGSIDPVNLDHIKWCIQLFGSCRIGLNLPVYAEDQFESGLDWDVSTTGKQSTNGHDVPLVGYNGNFFTCVTWGKLQQVTPSFLYKYCEEAHSELYFDWSKEQGMAPSGFSLSDLALKLQEVV
jgi:hypothetical protein